MTTHKRTKRELDDWLSAFVSYAIHSETPVRPLWWSGVSAIAGALQRNVFIDQGRYKLYPNFYTVLVSAPGLMQKSTTINYAIDLLRGVEGVRFSPRKCTWEAFIKVMEDAHKNDDADGDSKPLDLDTKVYRASPITVIASELSVFLDLKDEGMVSALIDLWDCPEVFDKVTKFSGSEFIERPCVNLFAGTTPSWIRSSFDRWSREGGLVSRCIFIYEDRKRKPLAFPRKHMPKDIGHLQQKLITDLIYINRLKGAYTFTKEAEEYEEERYEKHYYSIINGDPNAALGFRDRKQAHIFKTAMVIAASKRDQLIITLDDIKEAETRIDEVEGDLSRVFSVLDDRPEIRPFQEVRAILKHEQTLRLDKLISRLSSKYLVTELKMAVDTLIATGEVVRRQDSQNRITLQYNGPTE